MDLDLCNSSVPCLVNFFQYALNIFNNTLFNKYTSTANVQQQNIM